MEYFIINNIAFVMVVAMLLFFKGKDK
jgi:hypothetical protein